MIASPVNNTICAISEELTCFLNENPQLEETEVCQKFGFRELVTSYVFSHLFPCDGNISEQVRSMCSIDYCSDTTFRTRVRDQIAQFISEANQ